jgi:Domain of unknown function (DUF4932)
MINKIKLVDPVNRNKLIMKTIFLVIIIFIFINNCFPQSKLNIQVDEKFELLITVQFLSDYFLITKSDINYKNEILKEFESFKTHKAIELAKIIGNDFFVFDYPVIFFLHYSFPELKQVVPFENDDRYFTYKDTLDLFVDALRDFYEVTNFHEFFVNHKTLYDRIITQAGSYTNGKNIPELLEEHYGVKNHSYNLILCPLMHDGGFGPAIQTKDAKDLYAFIGPESDSKGEPQFDTNVFRKYVIHEFSHSFCNLIIDENYSRLAADSCLKDIILSQMKKQGYSDWRSILYEHLVRANEIFLLEEIYGESVSNSVFQDYVNERNFLYLDGLLSIIKNYSGNRIKYPTEADIGPVICDYFDNQKAVYCK